MSNQTAVEYLEEVFKEELYLTNMDFKQAKEMEKQQIIDAWEDGMKSDNGYFGTATQYYNETFNK